MTEWEFLNEVVHAADCGILLDVNNIYVSSQNHNFDPMEYVNSIPAERVAQIHIAGHSKFEKYTLDTHDHPVLDPVWRLYARAIERCGPTATLLEWDDNIPSFEEVHGRPSKQIVSCSLRSTGRPTGYTTARGGACMNLLELQRRMAEDVRRPLTSDFEMQKTTDDGASSGRSPQATSVPTSGSLLSNALRSTTGSIGFVWSVPYLRTSPLSMLCSAPVDLMLSSLLILMRIRRHPGRYVIWVRSCPVSRSSS